MNAKRVAAAEVVILAAMQTRSTAAGVAVALESACLLQSSESAAEARQLRNDVTGACLARYEEERENARLRLAWKSARERAQAYGEGILRHVEERDSYAKWLEQEQGVTLQLRAQVAELQAERHSTNESLSDTAEALRMQRDRVAELDALELGAVDGRVSAACGVSGHPTWLRAQDDTLGCPWCRVAELEAAAGKVAKFCAARAEYVDNINNCAPSNDRDYWRWNGHAEARRQLSQALGLPVAWPAESTTVPVPTEDVAPQVAKLRGILAGQRAAVDSDAPGPYGDPITYGPTGVRCGCGRDAHSNLSPCKSDEHPTAGELAEQRHLVDPLDHALEALAPRTVLGGTDVC